jgi:hypothetical protein
MRIIGTATKCERCGRAMIGDKLWGESCPFCTSKAKQMFPRSFNVIEEAIFESMSETMERGAR